MKRLVFAALLLLAAAPVAAQNRDGNGATSRADVNGPQTGCRVSVMPTPASSWVIRGYDPFGGGVSDSNSYSITFTNIGTAECRFRPVFELAQPPFGLRNGGIGAPVGYVLLDVTNSIDVTPRAARSQPTLNQRQIVLAPNAQEIVSYRLALVADDVRTDGTFTQELSVEAQDTQGVAYGGMRLVVGVQVVPSARIGLAGAYRTSDGRALVDLGELRPGPAAVPLNLRVNSTGRYSISVQSANAGRLRLGDSMWSVSYSMGLGGENVDLSGGTRTMSGPQGAGYRRDALPIQFVVGNTDNMRAGIYRDTITISVAAN